MPAVPAMKRVRSALLVAALSTLTLVACSVKSSDQGKPQAGSAGQIEPAGEAGVSTDAGSGGVGQVGEAGASLGGVGQGGEAGAGPESGTAGAAGAADSEGGAGGERSNPGHVLPVDADGDGFEDAIDPNPSDPSDPGDFSTPEKIAQDPRVKVALAAAKAANVEIATHTELTVPDVSGYYSTADGNGYFAASGNGVDVGLGAAGGEQRITAFPDATMDSAGVSFTNNAPVGFGLSQGTLLRGTAREITLYSRGKGVCTVNGANYATYGIYIGSAVIDPISGDWKDQRTIGVTVATKGTLTTACATSLAGDREIMGGWVVQVTPLMSFVTAGQLKYMCVDEKAAYAPTETWTRTGGAHCTCNYPHAISCVTP